MIMYENNEEFEILNKFCLKEFNKNLSELDYISILIIPQTLSFQVFKVGFYLEKLCSQIINFSFLNRWFN